MDTSIQIKKIKEENFSITIHSPVIIFRKYERNWIAEIPQLRIFGYSEQGKDEAIEDLKESLKVFFEIHGEDGTLEEALTSFGWKPGSTQKSKVKKISEQGNFVPPYGYPDYEPANDIQFESVI